MSGAKSYWLYSVMKLIRSLYAKRQEAAYLRQIVRRNSCIIIRIVALYYVALLRSDLLTIAIVEMVSVTYYSQSIPLNHSH